MQSPELIGDKLLFSYYSYVEGIGNQSFDIILNISQGVKLTEEIGVKGGHIGWTIETLDRVEEFGRKHRDVMDQIKKLLEGNPLYSYVPIKDVPSPGF